MIDYHFVHINYIVNWGEWIPFFVMKRVYRIKRTKREGRQKVIGINWFKDQIIFVWLILVCSTKQIYYMHKLNKLFFLLRKLNIYNLLPLHDNFENKYNQDSSGP